MDASPFLDAALASLPRLVLKLLPRERSSLYLYIDGGLEVARDHVDRLLQDLRALDDVCLHRYRDAGALSHERKFCLIFHPDLFFCDTREDRGQPEAALTERVLNAMPKLRVAGFLAVTVSERGP